MRAVSLPQLLLAAPDRTDRFEVRSLLSLPPPALAGPERAERKLETFFEDFRGEGIREVLLRGVNDL